MKKFLLSLAFSLVFLMPILGQNFTTTELAVNQHIEGTLYSPIENKTSPLVIFIAGSGPTDRDGNQSFMKNDMLKKMAIFYPIMVFLRSGMTKELLNKFAQKLLIKTSLLMIL